MAESAVTFLLRKLGSLIEEELKSLGRVKGEIVFIRDELQSMSAFLRVADAIEDTDPEIQAWVKQVRDVALDTNDVLDEFMLRFARHHHHRGFYGSVCKIYYQIKNMKARRQISSDIQDIKARVIDIAKRRQRYGYKFSSTSEQASSSNVANNGGWYDRRGDALLLEEADLVGIDKPKQQLIDWVLYGDSRLKVISVVGMGGLDKTTLIKKVYDDLEVKRQFQTHAWITVSQSFNIEEILTGLIQQLFDEVRRPLPHRFETMDNNNLKAVLKEFLQESRYVLVLDDIWSVEAWDAIKIALPNRNCGSRVLLTTRIGLFMQPKVHGKKGNAGCLPQLVPDQTLKLKQLTVLTLAETNKLNVTNVRELEDFLINECMYVEKGPFSENPNVMNNIFSEVTTPKNDIP
ncbi:Disease resistance protein RPM1 [Camellia lanceoleosa]|uniref:Disease resistance protein RPM1 n=1 Tax=Camellia lanceoleosa TaxID=1840588 RepID=A0ACC0G0V9_9ERIC|nr:Disease resistance protein RPM1 [Camellia lanceoleosa]